MGWFHLGPGEKSQRLSPHLYPDTSDNIYYLIAKENYINYIMGIFSIDKIYLLCFCLLDEIVNSS